MSSNQFRSWQYDSEFMKSPSLFRSISCLGAASLTWAALAQSTTVPKGQGEWKLPPEPFTLKNSPGVELMKSNCLLCHSTEYISTQPPLKRGQWEAEVTKMRVKFTAPISTNSVPELVDYLVRNYGTTNR